MRRLGRGVLGAASCRQCTWPPAVRFEAETMIPGCSVNHFRDLLYSLWSDDGIMGADVRSRTPIVDKVRPQELNPAHAKANGWRGESLALALLTQASRH